MHKKLTIKKSSLAKAESDMEYLQVILDKYNDLWKEEPEEFWENFNDNQVTLLFYGILYNQVQNGGFIQLIFNGYAPYVFSEPEPFAEDLKAWGAAPTAELLYSITASVLNIDGEMDKTSLESLSKSYAQYPEFNNYDNTFYDNNGLKEVKLYVEGHLSDFITVK